MVFSLQAQEIILRYNHKVNYSFSKFPGIQSEYIYIYIYISMSISKLLLYLSILDWAPLKD